MTLQAINGQRKVTRAYSTARTESLCRAAFILPSFAGGGAQRVLLTLLAGLDRTKFEPTLIVFAACGPLSTLCPGDVPIVELGQRRLRNAVPALVRKLRELRPQVIFSTFGHVNLALLAARDMLPGPPRIVIREPNTPSSSLPSLAYGRLLGLGYRVLYRRADCVVCPSELIARELEGLYRIRRRRLARLANPVDAENLRRLATPPLRDGGSGGRFVAVGRLSPQKGFDRLVQLFAQMPSTARLTILGDGVMEAGLRQTIADLGIGDRVTLGGFEPRPWPALAGADACLLPSRWEGMPNVALEALACGTPVIATPEAGGIVEVATAAPPSVILAKFGPDFLGAMKALAGSCSARELRPSRLPPDFELDRVHARFAELLMG